MALPSVPAPTFDLDTYSSNYTGGLLPLRLAHIAAHCSSLSHSALSLAITAAKAGKDTALYVRLLDLASLLGHADLQAKDADWLARKEDANKRELVRLEQELKGYKNNLIRESIRMGQEDLAMHLVNTGGPAQASVFPAKEEDEPTLAAPVISVGLAAAYAAMGKVRDHCSTPSHVAGMTLRLQQIAILQAVTAQQTGTAASGHWSNVLNSSNRLRTVGVKEEQQTQLTPLASAGAGLAHLSLNDYKSAAVAFISTPFALATAEPVFNIPFTSTTCTANDMAIYGALTALATMSRQDLQTRVLDAPFRAFLELEPHVRKALSLYLNAKYSACMALLSRYHADWSLDIFLGAGLQHGHSHVDRLFGRIREKSLTAYFSSFSSVSLTSLASTFPPPHLPTSATQEQKAAAMEQEVLQLITAGTLNARLDVVNRTLISPFHDLRSETLSQTSEVAEEIERGLRLRLYRVNCTLAGVEIEGKLGGDGSGRGVLGKDWSGGRGSGLQA